MVMNPGSFQNDQQQVQWALQQLEGKAGQWAVCQMNQMDVELDDQLQPPKELHKWRNFREIFMMQFGDPGLMEKAKIKWKQGLNQTGKAVDYFKEVESVLLCLRYPRDSDIVLDQVTAGLKIHICTHFIGKEWNSLNEMKAKVIPYDSAYWEINNAKATGEKTRTSTTTSRSKAPTTNTDQGKSTTPQVKAEVSRAGGTQHQYLSQDELEYCKKNWLCFQCKSDGKEVVRSIRFHLNHLPQNPAKTEEKKKNTKIAAMEGKERIENKDLDSDSDSDSLKN